MKQICNCFQICTENSNRDNKMNIKKSNNRLNTFKNTCVFKLLPNLGKYLHFQLDSKFSKLAMVSKVVLRVPTKIFF